MNGYDTRMEIHAQEDGDKWRMESKYT